MCCTAVTLSDDEEISATENDDSGGDDDQCRSELESVKTVLTALEGLGNVTSLILVSNSSNNICYTFLKNYENL